MPTVLHVMGCTNAGKTTFLQEMKARYGDGVHLVEVGRMMRAKYLDPASPHYSPGHFKGEAAPAHTQAEAWEMYLEGIEEGRSRCARLILVDGQPRDVSQAEGVFAKFERPEFLLIHANEEARRERLGLRFPDRDTDDEQAEGYRLGLERMVNDFRSTYVVLVELARRGVAPRVMDTSEAPIGEEGIEFVRGICPTVWSMFTGEEMAHHA